MALRVSKRVSISTDDETNLCVEWYQVPHLSATSECTTPSHLACDVNKATLVSQF